MCTLIQFILHHIMHTCKRKFIKNNIVYNIPNVQIEPNTLRVERPYGFHAHLESGISAIQDKLQNSLQVLISASNSECIKIDSKILRQFCKLKKQTQREQIC